MADIFAMIATVLGPVSLLGLAVFVFMSQSG